MTQRQAFVALIAQSVVAIAVLVCATVLSASGHIDASAVTALFGAAIGLVGPATVSLGARAMNGGPQPDYATLARVAPHLLPQAHITPPAPVAAEPGGGEPT